MWRLLLAVVCACSGSPGGSARPATRANAPAPPPPPAPRAAPDAAHGDRSPGTRAVATDAPRSAAPAAPAVPAASAASAPSGPPAAMPGVSHAEILIGQTMPYSGPASPYSTIGRTEQAYLQMINDAGGVNGRRVTLISKDDGYSPPKTVEHVRQLVERDGVAFIFGSMGTASNAAIQAYLNQAEVPQLFVASGADRWAKPDEFPW